VEVRVIDKIVQFPAGSVNLDDEALQRLKAEVERRAAQSGFGLLWPDRDAPRLGITPEKLVELVKTRQKEMAEAVKAERFQDEREARNQRRRESKEKSRAQLFRRLKDLPEGKRRPEVELWCRAHEGEDVDVVLVEFSEYAGIGAAAAALPDRTLWPEPVSGSELITELKARIRRHLVLSDDQLTVVAFWCLQAWSHNSLANYVQSSLLFLLRPVVVGQRCLRFSRY
jgi:hypothetical protein